VGDGADMRDDALLRWFYVRRHGAEQGVGTRGCRLDAKGNRRARGQGGTAGNHRHAARSGLRHRAHGARVLRQYQRGGLAGAATNDQRGGATVNLSLGQAGQGRIVNVGVAGWRSERGQ